MTFSISTHSSSRDTAVPRVYATRACSHRLLHNRKQHSANGIAIEHGSDDLYVLTMAVAGGKLTKGAIAEELRRLAGADG